MSGISTRRGRSLKRDCCRRTYQPHHQVHSRVVAGQGWAIGSGRVDFPESPIPDHSRKRADSCVVYLEAATLWPHRVEWRANAKSHPILEIEWRNARINHPLAQHDCVALFTYTPQP